MKRGIKVLRRLYKQELEAGLFVLALLELVRQLQEGEHRAVRDDEKEVKPSVTGTEGVADD